MKTLNIRKYSIISFFFEIMYPVLLLIIIVVGIFSIIFQELTIYGIIGLISALIVIIWGYYFENINTVNEIYIHKDYM